MEFIPTSIAGVATQEWLDVKNNNMCTVYYDVPTTITWKDIQVRWTRCGMCFRAIGASGSKCHLAVKCPLCKAVHGLDRTDLKANIENYRKDNFLNSPQNIQTWKDKIEKMKKEAQDKRDERERELVEENRSREAAAFENWNKDVPLWGTGHKYG